MTQVDVEGDAENPRIMLSMRRKVAIVGFCFLITMGITAYTGIPRFVQAVKNVAAQTTQIAEGDNQYQQDREENKSQDEEKYPGYESLLLNQMDPTNTPWPGGEIRFCRERSLDGTQRMQATDRTGCWGSQPEQMEKHFEFSDGYLSLKLLACPEDMTGPEVYDQTGCADQDSPVKISYRWNGFEEGFNETTHKIVEIILRCSDNNYYGGAMGWGISATTKPEDLGHGLISSDDLSFFSPYLIGPRFESYSSESSPELRGFWATCSDDKGNMTREPINGIDLTGWHTYTIYWEKGNTTYLIDGEIVASIETPTPQSSGQDQQMGMGMLVYLENTIYEPINQDQARYESIDTLLRDFRELGGGQLRNPIPSFKYGASDLENTKWIEIDNAEFYGKPGQAALNTGGGIIPDLNLETLIIESLGVNTPITTITIENLKSIKTLTAWSKGITDLTGLEHASNLEQLRVPNNEIKDITPLTRLVNLRELQINGNKIEDISPLTGLGNLEILYLGTDQISDISPLTCLDKLEELYVQWNPKLDLSTLTDLRNLVTLKLSYNDPIDLSPLAGLANLEILWILGNQILDLTPLTKLANLGELVLSDNYSTNNDSQVLGTINTLIENGILVQYEEDLCE